ncbi:uncharacterized protein LOC124122361 isoform X1 [Haliotis rufescens]|uniref:uncharacterized protein LOC124122361 isoform X1 n=1 Tax=Haliotis rufescens TaxID=6454 RepID=UPI00201E8DD2|nr:uncharacterized protein LOC124122361 isoform X1 [Haliotis rufescens]
MERYNNPVYDPVYGVDRQQRIFEQPSVSTVGRSLSSFFIDHVNKGTSWEDPRFKKPTQPQAAQALSHTGGASQSHHAQHRGQGQRGESIAMRDMQRRGPGAQSQQQDTSLSRADSAIVQKVKAFLPTCPETVIKQTLIKNHNHYGHTVSELLGKGYTKEQPVLQLTNTPASRLKDMFPAATAGVIQDVLAMCSNNEEEAKDQLIDLGFQPAHGSRSTSRTVSPSHSPRHHETTSHSSSTHSSSSHLSPRHTTSGHRRSSGNHSRHSATSPQPTAQDRPNMSEAEKERVKSKLKSQYPNVGADIVTMALEATGYNEESAKRVLGGTYSSKNQSSGQRASASASFSSQNGRSASNNAPVAMASEASLDPVAFTGDRPTASEGRTQGSSHASSSSETTAHGARGSSQDRRGATPTSQQQKAKQVTKMSEQLLTTTNDMLNHLATSCCLRDAKDSVPDADQSQHSLHSRHRVRPTATHVKSPARRVVTSQPRRNESAYKTQAQGPNPALRNGPDKTLLLSEYTPTQGPNPANRCGPDRGRVHGSQGAQGPDLSLRCGPQSEMHKGPSIENLSEPNALSLLVSAV